MKKLTAAVFIAALALAGSTTVLAASRRPVETITQNETVSAQVSANMETEELTASSAVRQNGTAQTPTPEQRKITRTYIAEKGEELGNFGDWSLEDKHEYSLWVESQGIPQDQTVHGLPGEDNMSEEEAVLLAKETIAEVYRLKEAALEKFNVQVEFNVIDSENPVWQIYFDVKDSDDFAALGLYRVFIDDTTKEIIKLEDASDYAISPGELTTLPDAAG